VVSVDIQSSSEKQVLAKAGTRLDCDVIVVNFNAGSLLADCVSSVLTAGADRCIVVDNASSDGSIESLEREIEDDRLQIIRNPRNVGFASACNTGAQRASANRLLFLNPDCTLSPGALPRMLQVLEDTPEIGLVGGFLSNPDGSEQAGGRRVFPTPRRAFIRAFGLSRLGRWFPRYFSDFLLHTEPLPTEPTVVEAISGACMLAKREAISDVGPWDEAYFLHCEDLDWCMRFKLKGWQVVFVPDAKVVHVKGICSRSRPIFVEWHKHHGMLRFYHKFFHDQYPGPLWLLVSAGVWFRFVLVAAYHGARGMLGRAE
jgi:GT2 family glycosyltransferase